MNFEYKQVILARKDLRLSKGKLAAQVAHASVTCAFLAQKNKKDWFDAWVGEGQKKVVVQVEDKSEMISFYMQAKSHSLPACLITDAGLTEIKPGTMTTAGIGPAPVHLIDAITGCLKLL